jgi:phospholipid/cholesterol/gamma-HCH transport system substrate-binding protein
VSRLPSLRRRQGRRRRSPVIAGAVFAVVVLVGFVVAFNKHHIQTDLRSGKTISAEFPRQYLLRKYLTYVKIAGIDVGTITGVSHNAQGALVTMKIFGDNVDKLGTEPTAQIRLTTLLGGNVYVQLYPGGPPGRPDGTIPVSRSSVPVYFDNLQDSITPPADEGIRKFINQNDEALAGGGTTSLGEAFAAAPGALVPGGQDLNALEGEQDGDLTDLIAATAQEDATLTNKLGQIESVVHGLGTFSSTLGTESPALAETIAHLPANEAGTQAGLTALNSILDELDATSAVSRPTVQSLTQLLVQSQPTLVDAAPVLGRLQPFLADATPLLGQLVPTVSSATTVLGDIKGPTLDHLNGPATTSPNGRTIPAFLPELLSTQHVELQRPATLYQEIGYVLAGLDSATSFYDQTGHQSFVILGQGPQNNYNPGVDTGNSTNDTYQHGTGCGNDTCPAGDGVTP